MTPVLFRLGDLACAILAPVIFVKGPSLPLGYEEVGCNHLSYPLRRLDLLEFLTAVREKLALRTRWRKYSGHAQILSTGSWLRYLIARRSKEGTGKVVRLRPPELLHPIHVRAGSSDLDVVRQVLLEKEYESLLDLRNVALVIDCGANIGCSASYFLSHFKGATVISVEPDPCNFALLERNLAQYGSRSVRLRAGIWHEEAPLALDNSVETLASHWTRQVRPSHDGEGQFPGVTIPSLLAGVAQDRISLLKMDIEGAEAELFRHDVSWIDQVDTIAIELHPNTSFGDSRDVFARAIEGRGFDVSVHGELTICRRDAVRG